MNLLIEKIKISFRHPWLPLFYVIVPILLAFSLGQLYEEGQRGLVIPVALVDQDESDYSRMVMERLMEDGRLGIEFLEKGEAEKRLLKNDIDSFFLIKQGFQEQLLKGKREPVIEIWTTETSIADGIVKEKIAAEILRLDSNIEAANWVVKTFENLDLMKGQREQVWQDAYHFTDEQWNPEPLMIANFILDEEGTKGKEKSHLSKPDLFFSPYLGLWTFFTMLTILVSCDWIIKEKQILFARMKSTEKGVIGYLFASLGERFLVHLFQMFLFILLAIQHDIIDGSFSLIYRMVMYILICISLGIFLASNLNDLGSFYVSSSVISFIFCLFGGSFFPIQELYGLINVNVFQFTPQQWVLDGSGKNPLIGNTTAFLLILTFWLPAIRRFRKNL